MTRPVVAGFHPDPSVCRVGDTFYLVNSTFEYLPGVPLRSSTDLVTWSLVGNVLDRPSQLPAATTGAGIFAPTLRFHDGWFWMVTTDMNRIGQGQLIVRSRTPEGPWSDPVFVAGAIGIDPDLAWGDDGACRLTWCAFDGRPAIAQAVVDPATGEMLSGRRELARRDDGVHIEGPHLYRRGGWWYFVTAEGGTERGHMVWVARSRSIDGPFERAAGPLLTRRSVTGELQNVGHGDLVELADGSWAMVVLGVLARGESPGFHVNGRETFLVGIDWADGWPVAVPDRFEGAPAGAFVDDFASPSLCPEWISPGCWSDGFATPGAGLRLRASSGDRRMVGLRCTTAEWDFDAVVADGCPNVVVRIDDKHNLRVRLEPARAVAEMQIAAGTLTMGEAGRGGGDVTVRVSARAFVGGPFERGGPDELTVSVDGVEIARVDGRYLSTEVAGGFTGRVVGLETGESPALVRGVALRPRVR